MPVWQLSELEGAMHLFPGVDKDRLHDLYRKWGGSIRWCLSNALQAKNHAEWAVGINSTDVSALETAITGRELVDKVCIQRIQNMASRILVHDWQGMQSATAFSGLNVAWLPDLSSLLFMPAIRHSSFRVLEPQQY